MTRQNYHALGAKVRACAGALLTDEDYAKLMAQPTREERLNRLRTFKNYTTLLFDEDPYQVEKALDLHQRETLNAIGFFLLGKEKEVYEKTRFKATLTLLKEYVRALIYNRQEAFFATAPLFRLRTLFMEDITLKTTLPEAVAVLRDRDYTRVLEPFIDGDSADLVFNVEQALDRHYYTTLLKTLKHLDKKDQALIYPFIGGFIDGINLSLIYRMKRFFQRSESELLSLVIDGGAQFKLADLEVLVECSTEELVQKLWESLPKEMERSQIEGQVFKRLTEAHMTRARNLLRSGGGLAPVLAYEYLLEIEIQDVKRVLAASDYELSKDEIRGFLTHRLL